MKTEALAYTDLKALISRKNLAWQHGEQADHYRVFAVDPGGVAYEAKIYKASAAIGGVDPAVEAANLADFEANYKPNSNYAIGTRPYPFATPDFDFAGEGVLAEVPAGQTVDIDYKIDPAVFPSGAYVNGASILTKGAAFGDYGVAEIVDRDNVLGYGAGLVLKTYVRKWYFMENGLLDIVTPYAGLIPPGLVIRVKATNTGAAAMKVAVNYRLHKAL